MHPNLSHNDNELLAAKPTIKKENNLNDFKDFKEDNKVDAKINDDTQNKNISGFNSSPEYIESIKSVLDHAKKLEIKIIVSSSVDKGTVLVIEPLGLVGSIRTNKGDGISYFGFISEDEQKDNKVIDYLIVPKEDNFDDRFKGRHFQIRFNPSDLKYYICDLNNGYGTFVKINQELTIKDNFLINLGNSYIVFIFEDVKDNNDNKSNSLNKSVNKNDIVVPDNCDCNKKILILKIFSVNIQMDPFYCYNTKNTYLIGREDKCDVVLNDSLLSRIHCSLIYKESVGWCLVDGYYNPDGHQKKSTNGSWLYVMNETEIYDGMMFKGNQNIYRCSYY